MATRVDELRNGNGRPSGVSHSYADLDDRMLVLDFQTGNGNREPAFAEIHRRYSGLARHICFRILANATDAEDATQETMLRLLQGLGRFNGRYRLQPWVARIATNVSLDVLRTRARRPQSTDRELIELDAEPDDAAEPSVLVEQLLERERVQKVLAELPEHHRAALVLREYEGRSHEEIGRALGVTPSQAKALIHRAKGSFRRAWDRKEERSRGLAALGPLFLAPFRVSEWFRRLFGSATEAAAATSASPAITTTAISAGERVTAAAVVVMMAATVGVGAVALRHGIPDTKDGRQSIQSLAPSPAAPVVVPAVGPERAEPKLVHRPGRAKRVKPAKDPAPVEVAPVVSPTPNPSPSVEPPTTTPPPVVVPQPIDFTVSASSDFQTTVRCGCASTVVTSQTVDAKPEGITSFSTEMSDAGVADATGQIAWGMWLQQSSPDGVAHEMTFELGTAEGPERYTAAGTLVSSDKTPKGVWTYVFEGSYAFSAGPPEGLVQVPGNGTYRIVVIFSGTEKQVEQVELTLTQVAA